MNKICIVIPYFGKWPVWFNFFLKSCEFNPNIDWFFYTDCPLLQGSFTNVKFFHATIDDFNMLASDKIGMDIDIKRPYKLCDFRPAFGKIFENFLTGYDFWGWGDVDVVYGRFDSFITPPMLSKYDVIATSFMKLFGPLTLLRNVPKVNELYKKGQYYKTVFKDEKSYAFDENLGANKERVLFVNPNKLSKTEISSFSRIVNEALFKKELEVRVVNSKIHIDRNCADICFKFDKGKLVNLLDDKEILFIHFGYKKKFIKNTKIIGDVFYITNVKLKYLINRLKLLLGIKNGRGSILIK